MISLSLMGQQENQGLKDLKDFKDSRNSAMLRNAGLAIQLLKVKGQGTQKTHPGTISDNSEICRALYLRLEMHPNRIWIASSGKYTMLVAPVGC